MILYGPVTQSLLQMEKDDLYWIYYQRVLFFAMTTGCSTHVIMTKAAECMANCWSSVLETSEFLGWINKHMWYSPWRDCDKLALFLRFLCHRRQLKDAKIARGFVALNCFINIFEALSKSNSFERINPTYINQVVASCLHEA